MNLYERLTAGPVFLIAEIGSNHNGDFDLVRRLMDVAQRSGADAVKFQSFLADHLVTKDSPDYALLKKIEVPREWYPKLKAEAESRGLVFFSTATNDITLGWMEEVGVELYKLASPNLTHIPLIRKTASFHKPIIMSTGMAGLFEIDEAVRAVQAMSNRYMALLHCVSEYPADPSHLNLRFIKSLQKLYPYPVGFSDHSLEIGTAVAAVALGARIIEKHLTLDRTSSGPDHHYSLEPGAFIMMAQNIRVVEQALGSEAKAISKSETEKTSKYWRSLHASRDLKPGTMLKAEDIGVVRPNDGLHPRHLEDVIGMTVKKNLSSGQPITWKDLK